LEILTFRFFRELPQESGLIHNYNSRLFPSQEMLEAIGGNRLGASTATEDKVKMNIGGKGFVSS